MDIGLRGKISQILQMSGTLKASPDWSFSSTLLQAGAFKLNSSKKYKGSIVLTLTTRTSRRENLEARQNSVVKRQTFIKRKAVCHRLC